MLFCGLCSVFKGIFLKYCILLGEKVFLENKSAMLPFFY